MNNQNIINKSISDEMKESYLDYSMSVIVSRALPDVRDGLKPSQRRILVAMNDLHLTPDAHYRKSAKIAGDTSGNYHPHGEAVIYPTMVKMAQDFSLRYPLVDGQGNFGSIDGDPPAAMRYTEAKMAKPTIDMITDIEKATVTHIGNYDATRTEPSVLPALFPNLLCNGTDGIAVGMATRIPPHNLVEVVTVLREMIKMGNKWTGKALYNELRLAKESKERTPRVLNGSPEDIYENYIPVDTPDRAIELDKIRKQLSQEPIITLYPEFESEISIQEIMKFIPGPDFPTGAIIYDQKEIENAYATGRGRILIRAKAAIEEDKKGRFTIVITEVPYQVNKSAMQEKIADLVKDKKIEGISDIRDESNREGLRVVITLKKEAQPKVVLNKLFKYTEMQKSYNANMIALVDGEPRTLNLKNMLELYLTHRFKITIRKYEFEIASAKFRAHILEGYLKALDVIDEIISTIRASKTQEDALNNLIEKFDFTQAQAQAILDMQLRRLAALERQKIEDEYKEISKKIDLYTKILSSDTEVLKEIDQDLAYLQDKYSDPRRTKVVKGKVDEITVEDIVAEEETLITISHTGYIKRASPQIYKTQNRGGKGIIGATTKEDDYIEHAIACSTHDELLIFTNFGKVYSLKAHEIPDFKRTAKGIPIVNLLQLSQNESVTTVLVNNNATCGINDDVTTEASKELPVKYLFMATKHGYVKKTDICNFQNIRNSGLVAIKLNDQDELGWVEKTTGQDKIMLITKKGKCIRFNEKDVREMGRTARGVTGIRMKQDGDNVIAMVKANNEDEKLLVISEKGMGKTTKLSQYTPQRRGGSGIFTFRMKAVGKTGLLVNAKIVSKSITEAMIISEKGIIIKVPISSIKELNRQTSGVKVMNMSGDDKVSAIVLL